MGQIIAKSISYIFHPLFLPTFGLLVIFSSGSYHSYIDFAVKKIILMVYFIATVLLPLSVFPFLYYQRIIRNWSMSLHRERILPTLIVSAFQFFAWYMINRYSVPPLYKSFIFYSAIATLITALVSLKINISLHMMSIGALIGFTLGLAFSKSLELHGLLMAMFIVAGLIAFSRLALNKSRPVMIYLSFIVGFLLLFTPIYFL